MLNDKEISEFIANWPKDDNLCKTAFIELKDYLSAKDDILLDFNARPGISYSLRAAHINQKNRPLFVMVDVIEDEPRWLSVCFYGQMVTDPEETGDFVPDGLLGEDAVCFDLESYQSRILGYLRDRIDEAHRRATTAE
ncbi:MAG: hypothetical protein R6U13_12375 [Desulfatiglandaceae bacterium]